MGPQPAVSMPPEKMSELGLRWSHAKRSKPLLWGGFSRMCCELCLLVWGPNNASYSPDATVRLFVATAPTDPKDAE